jgi:hypothetical protein
MAMADANEYTFQGDGIHASWIPGGAGPATTDGLVTFTYTDSHQSKVFRGGETSVTSLPGLGRLVTVVLADNAVSHAQTSFSVLVPDIGVDVNQAQTFHTKAITTAEGATLVKLLTFPALQTYKVEHLLGTARIVEIPF